MGLFRLATVVAVGVALLPAEREKQEQLYTRAASAVTWTVTFCDRNAMACAQASTLWADFSKKAEFGIKLAYDVMHDSEAAANRTATAAPPAGDENPTPAAGTSLTPRDLRPAWRGKTANKAGI